MNEEAYSKPCETFKMERFMASEDIITSHKIKKDF